MTAYSLELRERVMRRAESIRQTAKRYAVLTNLIVRLRQHSRATGQLTPKPRGGKRRPGVDETGSTWLTKLLYQEPSLTLNELGSRYETVPGVRGSKSSMDRALRRWGISYKKNHRSIPTAPVSGSSR